MKTLGLTDVIGPIMVGPSSSHTAGALRIAYMARRLCLAEPKTVEFRLLGSFAHTLTGHGTDKALVAGMLGLATDDLRIRDSFDLAREAGLAFSFVTLPDAEYDHPNTIDVRIVDAAGNAMDVRGESIGGGAAVIRKIDDIDVRITGESASIVVRQRDEKGVLAHIAQSISDEGVNIATTRMYRERKGDTAYTVLETDQAVGAEAKAAIEDHPAIYDVRIIPGDARADVERVAVPDVAAALQRFAELDFGNGAALLAYCEEHGATLSEAFLAREAALAASLGYADGAAAYLREALAVMRCA
ncbi:MAG: L-serine ammonia-lyase, iron-sulfur-dependent subunit beta, partial [Eggerthella lenta]